MKQSLAVCVVACVLTGCADPSSTQLDPTGPRYVTIDSQPVTTLTLSAPAPCVTRVEWERGGIAEVVHMVELEGGTSLAAPVALDKPPRSSTAQWDANDFYGGTNRVPTGRIAAIARDRKGNVVASAGPEAVNFDCGAP
jgi:hypothetical protein